jgi:hypothetical protein
MVRYAQASEGQTSYGIEGTRYSQASSSTTYFGFIRDDHEPPAPNPHQTLTTEGADRVPYVNSPEPIDYEWTVPFDVLDHNAPFEVALGSRTSTTKNSGSADEYTEHLFELANRLPTMTLQHNQADLSLEAHYIGTKANLSLSASQGEILSAEMTVRPAQLTYNDSVSTTPNLGIPEQDPFRFSHVGDMTLTDPSNGSTIKTVAEITAVDWSIDNGLEANHHGGREPYAIKETTAGDLLGTNTYDVTITDLDLYKRAVDNQARVNIEVPFVRDTESGTDTDAIYIRDKKAKIVDAPVPRSSEGDLVPSIEVAPTDTEIEVREPA